MTNESNASTTTTTTATAMMMKAMTATNPPPSTPAPHQNASPCITKTISSQPPKPPQTPPGSSLAARATPPISAEVMQGGATSLYTLSPTQLKALDLLLSGLPDVHIAQALGVHRTTIYRWKTLHPAFVAEYNRLRIDAWDACHQRLRHLLPRALSALGKGLRSDNPSVALRSATTLLRHAAPDKDNLPPPPDRKTATTPDAFIDSFVQAHRRSKGKDPHKPITDKERDPVIHSLLRHLGTPDQ